MLRDGDRQGERTKGPPDSTLGKPLLPSEPCDALLSGTPDNWVRPLLTNLFHLPSRIGENQKPSLLLPTQAPKILPWPRKEKKKNGAARREKSVVPGLDGIPGLSINLVSTEIF